MIGPYVFQEYQEKKPFAAGKASPTKIPARFLSGSDAKSAQIIEVTIVKAP
jgi:hypothetical protein